MPTKTQLVQAVVRATDLLELIAAARNGMRLKDLAAQTGLKTPTVHNLVRTLVHQGLVRKRNGHYVLGIAVLHLGERYRDQVLAADGTNWMIAFAESFPGATVTFAEVVDGEVLVTYRIEGARPPRLERPVAFKFHPYGSASGLAAQAFGGPTLKMRISGRSPFAEYGAHLWQDPDRLEAFLDDCRQQGHAIPPVSADQLFRVAVPVYCQVGTFIGVMGASRQQTAADSGVARDLTAALRAGVRKLGHQAT